MVYVASVCGLLVDCGCWVMVAAGVANCCVGWVVGVDGGVVVTGGVVCVV